MKSDASKSSSKKVATKNDISIEESFENLDKLIEQMDSDKCSIEKSMELYEKGIKILGEVTKKVDKIEKDMKVLEKDR